MKILLQVLDRVIGGVPERSPLRVLRRGALDVDAKLSDVDLPGHDENVGNDLVVVDQLVAGDVGHQLSLDEQRARRRAPQLWHDARLERPHLHHQHRECPAQRIVCIPALPAFLHDRQAGNLDLLFDQISQVGLFLRCYRPSNAHVFSFISEGCILPWLAVSMVHSGLR